MGPFPGNHSTLETIGKEIEALQQKSRVKRFKTWVNDPGKIVDMRQGLDEAIKVFMVRTLVTAQVVLVTPTLCTLSKVARELNTSLDVAMILDTLRSDGIKQILDGNTGAMMSKYAVLDLIS